METAVSKQAASEDITEKACDFLMGVLDRMGISADIDVKEEEDRIVLEIQTADDEAVLATITSAGAIFLGAHSPVSLGDYLAGSNHVLPTGGQSRFASGLGAYTFLRPQQVIDYDRTALDGVARQVVALSRAEALPAHGDAVTARFPAE